MDFVGGLNKDFSDYQEGKIIVPIATHPTEAGALRLPATNTTWYLP